MKRGEVWTVLGDSYAAKPRPVVIVQSDGVGPFDSTVLCLMTSVDSSDIPTRVRIEPRESNGLRAASWVMTDKVYSARTTELGTRMGRLSDEEMAEVSAKLAVVLGI